MGTLSLTKETWINSGEKTISTVTGGRKTGQLGVKRIKLEHFLTP